jgi:hypothetical protein
LHLGGRARLLQSGAAVCLVGVRDSWDHQPGRPQLGMLPFINGNGPPPSGQVREVVTVHRGTLAMRGALWLAGLTDAEKPCRSSASRTGQAVCGFATMYV